ncbi:MAG: hypothetical protein DDT31_00115 [Syntrophomonadaceae bacterium]|nr:hypothetical protein [Bacillota bacterium]MBT9137581.1 hypothetical protein [Bacillota bacterium]MBT9146525.1 hypothetical protein [Bacillota bacterium]
MARRKTDGKMISCKKCGKPLRSFIFKSSTWKHECDECDDGYYCGACIKKWERTLVCDKCYKALTMFKITSESKFVGYKVVSEFNLIIIEAIFTSMSEVKEEMTRQAFRIKANAVTNFKIVEQKETTEDETYVPKYKYTKETSPIRFEFEKERSRRTYTRYGAQGMPVILQKCSRSANG